jgi:hypothetical protein
MEMGARTPQEPGIRYKGSRDAISRAARVLVLIIAAVIEIVLTNTYVYVLMG